MSAHVVIITGISGCERWLGRSREEIDLKRARRFRSPRTAEQEARRYIAGYPRVIQRHMQFAVREAGR